MRRFLAKSFVCRYVVVFPGALFGKFVSEIGRLSALNPLKSGSGEPSVDCALGRYFGPSGPFFGILQFLETKKRPESSAGSSIRFLVVESPAVGASRLENRYWYREGVLLDTIS